MVQILKLQPRNAQLAVLDLLEAPVGTHRVRHYQKARLTLFASFRRVGEQMPIQELCEGIRFIAALIRGKCFDYTDEGQSFVDCGDSVAIDFQ